jgi:hypothetical protein
MNLNGDASLYISRVVKETIYLTIKPLAKKALNVFGAAVVGVSIKSGFLLQGVCIGNGHAVV